jgi:hypothetical protein
MRNPAKLTGKAAQLLLIMQTMSQPITAQTLMHTSGMSRTAVHGALKLLVASGSITEQTVPKRDGTGYQYAIASGSITEQTVPDSINSCATVAPAGYSDIPKINPEIPNFNAGYSEFQNFSADFPLRAHARSDENDDFSDDDESAQKISKIKNLLAEFLIGEPTKTQLANALLPILGSSPEKITDIRTICERTKAEGKWRNPAGVAVQRIRAMVIHGQQDPLPIFADLTPAQPKPAPAQRPASRPAYAKKAGSYRRPQVMTTDEERAADDAAAKTLRDEMRARRAARDAVKQEVTA